MPRYSEHRGRHPGTMASPCTSQPGLLLVSSPFWNSWASFRLPPTPTLRPAGGQPCALRLGPADPVRCPSASPPPGPRAIRLRSGGADLRIGGPVADCQPSGVPGRCANRFPAPLPPTAPTGATALAEEGTRAPPLPLVPHRGRSSIVGWTLGGHTLCPPYPFHPLPALHSIPRRAWPPPPIPLWQVPSLSSRRESTSPLRPQAWGCCGSWQRTCPA